MQNGASEGRTERGDQAMNTKGKFIALSWSAQFVCKQTKQKPCLGKESFSLGKFWGCGSGSKNPLLML